MSMAGFHPFVAQWFRETLGAPTRAQALGWEAIQQGRHALIAAPTGSGKTLAAFLTAIDQLVQEGLRGPLPDAVRVVYVSPLKALSADIHTNLAEPRRGIREFAERQGIDLPRITAAVRTGDTTSSERAAMVRTPPHILVTTPESLYLLLTAERSRQMLRSARTVIVDEIHAVIGTRRGAHLALSLERLERLVDTPLQRIGLSATQKPVDDVARYLVGAAEGRPPAVVVDEGHARRIDLTMEIPRSPLSAVMSHEVWTECYERLADLIQAHTTTLVFVNTRSLAERVARHLSERLGDDSVTAHHGSLSKERRLDAERRLKHGSLRALVATASLELGIDIGHVDLVCQIGSPRRIATLLQRVGRSGHSVTGVPKGRMLPVSRDDLIECAALLRSVRRGDLDRIVTHDAPLDVLAQQIVAEVACEDLSEQAVLALVRRAWPYREISTAHVDAVVQMLSDGFSTRRGRRSALVHRDEVHGVLRGRRGSRMLALTSGGAIPEIADYRVVLEPEETFIGTLNEDFAIESTAGDIFQLGNASWQIRQVVGGTVRVVDAHGAPPTIPFWLGEAPARSDELSQAVSDIRSAAGDRLAAGGPGPAAVTRWLQDEAGLPEAAAEQAAAYLAEGHAALGAIPTQRTLILERFFDESGGMQLVLHAPFGNRINRAWALALRKRFCRQFNFELQAATTDNALLLSLGPQHSFPLSDVLRYLHPATARDVLVQSMLDAPVFQACWRWNTTISLAVPRNRGGKKVPPQLQRMLADDLMAAVFPDAAACLENIPGNREIPDHPLVNQTVRDCLEEAMDFDGLRSVLSGIHAGEFTLLSRDTPQPSAFCHEILTVRPYGFVDDAPLEERRTQAVQMRRAGQAPNDLGALDMSAIERVREEVRPDPRDADELHDVLLTVGFLEEAAGASKAGGAGQTPRLGSMFEALAGARRAARISLPTPPAPPASPAPPALWVAAERLPEVLAVHGAVTTDPPISAPAPRLARGWAREEALVSLVRGRLTIEGPTTVSALSASLAITEGDADVALRALESDGAVLRGQFTPGVRELEWCDRRLLARIHRYTLHRLRAEIAPVSPAEFMQFLFAWQHVGESARLTGIDGLRAVIAQLDGLEIPARAWEREVLPSRIERYEPSMLDMLCLTGEVAWARLSSGPTQVVGATPVALFLRAHADVWLSLRDNVSSITGPSERPAAAGVVEHLRTHGASFAHEIAAACGLTEEQVRAALVQLVSAGLATSDGFAGLRDLINGVGAAGGAGRWSTLRAAPAIDGASVEQLAWTLLRRYGVMFRRMVTRETTAVPWRDLARVYRRLEARGDIRGGRFVSGMSGEQFALPDAIERLRETRRAGPDDRLIVVSAADPLNLTGIITPGDPSTPPAAGRIRSATANRVVYRNGVPIAAMEGDFLRTLGDVPAEVAEQAAALAAGRRVPVVRGFVGRASRT